MPWVGVFVIWLGMSVGCAIAWVVRRGLLGPVDRRIGGDRLATDWGWVAMVLMRPVPVLAEATVLTAAARGMGFLKLTTLTALANISVALLYGFFGDMCWERCLWSTCWLASESSPALRSVSHCSGNNAAKESPVAPSERNKNWNSIASRPETAGSRGALTCWRTLSIDPSQVR